MVRAGGFAEAEALVAAGAVRKAADVLATALYAQATNGEADSMGIPFAVFLLLVFCYSVQSGGYCTSAYCYR